MAKFHIGNIVSVITGRLLSLDGMDGIYNILNYMTGQSLMTHQIPEAMDVCQPELVRQFPALAAVLELPTPTIERQEDVTELLRILSLSFGDQPEVEPLDPKPEISAFGALFKMGKE